MDIMYHICVCFLQVGSYVHEDWKYKKVHVLPSIVVQFVNPSSNMSVSHLTCQYPTWAPASFLLAKLGIQLPANASGKLAEENLSAWATAFTWETQMDSPFLGFGLAHHLPLIPTGECTISWKIICCLFFPLIFRFDFSLMQRYQYIISKEMGFFASS